MISPFLKETTDGVVRFPSGFAMILLSVPSRTATADLASNDQFFMDNRLRWEGVKSGLRSCVASISGGLVVCMSLFRESLSQSFFIIFALYALMITYLIYSFYRLRRKYLLD